MLLLPGVPGSACQGSRQENDIERVWVVTKSPRSFSCPHPRRAGGFQGPPGGQRLQSGPHRDGIGARELPHRHKHRKLPAPPFLCSGFQLVHQTRFMWLCFLACWAFLLISDSFKLGAPYVPGAQGGLRVYL